jgi:pimeloyl-ACP methyl ester carboxylesterase
LSRKGVPIEHYYVEADGEVLAAFRTLPFRDAAPTAVILHGAGESSKERLIPLAEALSQHGLNATGFDFAGHGESTGRIEEMTLRRRAVQACAVIAHLSGHVPLVVCGFSMSGQTSCDILPMFGDRVKVMALFAPALYGAECEDLRFEAEFSDAIRQPWNWRRSSALRTIESFEGALLIYTSDRDDVIPDEVPELLREHAKAASLAKLILLAGAPHQLSEWLGDKPEQLCSIAKFIATLVPSLRDNWR